LKQTGCESWCGANVSFDGQYKPVISLLADLGSGIKIEDQIYSVYLENDVNDHVPSFSDDIGENHLNDQIVSCSILIDLPAGVADEDHSYGGYCELLDPKGTKSLVEICDDTLVGHFELSPIDLTKDDWSETCLATFVTKYCIGG
jgi:hypothetical protein